MNRPIVSAHVNSENRSKAVSIGQPIAVGSKAYWAWGSLLFSLFFFFPLTLGSYDFTLTLVLWHLLIYAGFLGCYAWGISSVLSENTWPALGIILVAFLGTSITPGTNSLYGYAAFLIGFGFPSNKAVQGLVGNLMAQVLAAFSFDMVNIYYLGPSMVASVGLFAFGFIERRERQHLLREARSEAEIEQLAVIAERERIARDLHDLVGHSLSSIALKAELAAKLLDADQVERAKGELQDLASVSRHTLSQIRQSVSGLKLKGLQKHLDALTAELQQQGFDVTVTHRADALPAKLESSLILMLTEAVTNILRHSRGDKVKIDLHQDEQAVHLRIQDNGSVRDVKPGNGLQGIAERCENLNGTLSISTESGMGLSIAIPREGK